MPITSYNGRTVVTMPVSPAPKSIEPVFTSIVGVATNPFSGQQQIQDWGSSYSEMTVTMPPMSTDDGLAWAQFLLSCNGQANVFQLPATGQPSFASLLPATVAPAGYWCLKANSVKWSINDGVVYGMEFEIREAI